jgi:hypothetical protein
MTIRIGCVEFTPHAFDVFGAVTRERYGCLSELDRLILDLCLAGF